RYAVAPEVCANCVIVTGRRAEQVRFAACVVLATTRVDVNGLVRRRLDARKASFAPMAVAVAETGMEYGGITPFGLPAGWPVLVDTAVLDAAMVVVGSGLRQSKLLIPGAALRSLTALESLDDLGVSGNRN
ncbi:MAG TPA: YbaK/EbsC family protein, partial [Mycobacteriales bacterium]|nr:YbaK/EbsC family protein [Mycobacteriales bacterium]